MQRRAGPVRGAPARIRFFITAQAASIGLKSCEYGGKNRTVAPARSISARTCRALGAARLSMTPTSPGRRCRTSYRRTHATKRTVFMAPPADGTFTAGAFDGVDAVVHLAGESIAGGRWTAARKARIRESRVTGTRQLCEKLARLDTPPKVLVAASA